MDRTAATALFAWLDREIWLVTAQASDRRGGLIATFVNQASIVPELPRVAVGIARQHHTWGLIESSGAFALHLLGEANLDWVGHFGLQSGRNADKFNGRVCATAVTGSPILDGSIGWLDCRVETSLETGDRTVYLAEVVESRVTHYGPPLTLKHLLQLLPSDQLSALKRQLHLDSTTDAEAITTWRQLRNRQGGEET